MASFEGLPTELVVSIVKHLSDNRKIDYFDPVGVQDLQYVRLVSRRMSTLVAPLLFENMILDEKLLDDEDLTRLSRFAEMNPHLAGHVRRLRRRLSPLIVHADHVRGKYAEQASLAGLHAAGLLGCDSESVLLDSLQDQFGFQPAFNKVRPCCDKSRISYLRTIKTLPNLFHLENTVSEYYLLRLKALAKQCGAESAWLLESLWIEVNGSGPLAPLCHLYSHLPEMMTPTVKSLKLLEMPLPLMIYSRWSEYLRGLEHLDIECRLPGDGLDEDDPRYLMNDVQIWHSEMQNLTNLRTLCLRGAGDWEDVIRLACPDDDTEPVWLDDLLQGGEFPHLQSLALVNWPVRETGLARIIRQYRASLQTLELRRLALGSAQIGRRGPVGSPWCRIAAVCAECPNLKRFRFQDLRVGKVPVDENDESAPLSDVAYWHFLSEKMASQWRNQEYYMIARGLVEYEATPSISQ